MALDDVLSLYLIMRQMLICSFNVHKLSIYGMNCPSPFLFLTVVLLLSGRESVGGANKALISALSFLLPFGSSGNGGMVSSLRVSGLPSLPFWGGFLIP